MKQCWCGTGFPRLLPDTENWKTCFNEESLQVYFTFPFLLVTAVKILRFKEYYKTKKKKRKNHEYSAFSRRTAFFQSFLGDLVLKYPYIFKGSITSMF